MRFFFEGDSHEIEFSPDGEVALDGKWYRTASEFIGKSILGGRRITAVYDELGRMVIV